MSVFIFVNSLNGVNGLVRSSINTANSLAEQGYDVHILSIAINSSLSSYPSLSTADNYVINKNVQRYSLNDLYVESNNFLSRKSNIFYEVNQQFFKAKYTKHIKDVLFEMEKNLDSDDTIIFTHPLQADLYRLSINNEESVATLILQIHGNFFEEKDNLALFIKSIDFVDVIQTVSDEMRTDMINKLNLPEEKIVFIPNIVEENQLSISSAKEAPFFNRDKKIPYRISIIGSIQPRKNQLDALKLIKELPEFYVLQIFGPNVRKQYGDLLCEYIKRHRLEDRVFFKGVCSEDYIYQNTDIVIMTSESEGFPYIFLESTVYGIPVVTYNFKYGANDYSNFNENNCVVPLGDYSSMSIIIKNMTTDKDVYFDVVEKNLERYKKEWSKKSILDKYSKYLKFNSLRKDLYSIFKRSHNGEEFDILLNLDNESKNHYWEIKGDFRDISLTPFIIENKTKKNISNMILQDYKCSFYLSRETLSNYQLGVEVLGKEKYLCHVNEKNIIEKHFQYFDFYNQKKNDRVELSDIPHLITQEGLFVALPTENIPSEIRNENGDVLGYKIVNKLIEGLYRPSLLIEGIFNEVLLYYPNGTLFRIDTINYSYSYIYDGILEAELETDLCDLTVKDIYIWELIRVPIIEKTMEVVGKWEVHFQKKEKINFKYDGDKKLNDCFKKENLIIEFPRKSLFDNKTIDYQSLDNTIIVEFPQIYGYSFRSYANFSNVVPAKDLLDSLCKKVSISLSDYDRKNIRNVENILKSKLGLSFDIFSFLKGRIEKFIKEKSFFDSLFKKNKFKKIFLPSSYWNPGIIVAAHENDVFVSDIQYAAITKYHPAYFKSWRSHYVADEILVWTKYWSHADLPNKVVTVTGKSAFKNELNKLKLDVSDVKYDVIFVSQSRVSNSLLSFALSFSEKYPLLKVGFSKHPDEELDFSKYKYIPDNFIVHEYSTLEGMAVSKNVVGVYSSSLFEAAALNKNVYIVPLPGHEIMTEQMEEGLFKLVSSEEELYKKISFERESTIYTIDDWGKKLFDI